MGRNPERGLSIKASRQQCKDGQWFFAGLCGGCALTTLLTTALTTVTDAHAVIYRIELVAEGLVMEAARSWQFGGQGFGSP